MPLQELRSREEELTRAALQQKSQEELLKRREQQLAEREINVLERELNILIFQLNKDKPNVKKRKGKFRRSRLKLKDGNRISLPSDFQHKITVQASPTMDKRRSLNSNTSSPPSSPTLIPRLRAIQLSTPTDPARRDSMYVYHQDVDVTSECEPPAGLRKKVTLDESNRTWGRSTMFKQEEFEDVRKGFRKKGRTWGPSSVQAKERAGSADRVRPLSDGNNPWSTSLMKTQRSVPLAALFAEQGTNMDRGYATEGPDGGKPKQVKLPSQVYIDLPLWSDEQRETGGAADSLEDPSTSTSSASTTPQVTPTNSLKRAPTRRRTDAALWGCASLLASVALGFDLREALKGPSLEEAPEPREEKKRKEGLFQRAARLRRSTSPPSGGRSRKEEVSPGPPSLIAMSSISECNSTRCLIQPDSEGADHVPAKKVPPGNPAEYRAHPCIRGSGTSGKPEAPPPAPAGSNSKLRRKKSAPVLCYNTNGTSGFHVSPLAPPSPGPASERGTPSNGISRPRPSSLRGRPHAWGLLRGRHKSASLGRHAGEKHARDLAGGGCSLLDVDTEGQKRDCTVPLCRIQSAPSGPSVYELEKEFLS
nr:mitogen-activated protein kinase kinase kinase 21-like isoform X1 [Paramormyrops kingsleyae]XP_023687305.1 mitogen-activated protein kinase kinase kinase 21-like isoform X1 [Paramormyrops kingsleyae]